jgi:hypothetical protein
MMNSKQVILYKPTAKISKDDLLALREAGFVPVGVESFNDVKVIDPFTVDSRNAVWMAAMEAIAKADTTEGAKTKFGRRLSELLSEMALPTGVVTK